MFNYFFFTASIVKHEVLELVREGINYLINVGILIPKVRHSNLCLTSFN